MTKLILDTTPLNPSPSDLEVLKLGDWAKIKNNKNASVVKYHWEDRGKLFKDHNYIFILYEKYLSQISNSLNSIHNVDSSIEYWRVVIGPWLYYFISITFDRYETIRIAVESYDIKYTKMPIYNPDDWVPIDYVDFNQKYYTDEWNYYLYSEIIKITKKVATQKSLYQLSPKRVDGGFKKKSLLKAFLFFLTRLTRNFSRKVLFVEVGIPQKPLYRLLYKLKSLTFSYYLRVRPDYCKPSHEKRSLFFKQSKNVTNFEKLLDVLIPVNIPTSYVEGFSKIKEFTKKIYPKKVDLIITSSAYFSNEHFKFWAADQKLNSSKLWVLVHGGHHGTALFNGPGKLTEDLADRFYCWGWGQYNLPSSKLSILRKHKIFQSGDKLLFIPYDVSKYSNHIDSSPIASSFNDCLEMHNRFFDELKAYSLDTKILIRLKSGMGHRNLELEYNKNANGIERDFIYSNKESLINSISRSELIIVSYDSTVFLEALTLNIPTCLFIRKDFWEMSDQSAQFFENFLHCGILHYDENSLVNHIIKVKDNYHEWWYSDLVQNYINSFLQKFGSSSDHWQKDWYDEIHNALNDN